MPRLRWMVVLILAVSSGCLELEDAESVNSLTSDIDPIGTTSAIDIATWNLSWFGSSRFGPRDEDRQFRNVSASIEALDIDLWAVQEVVSNSDFRDLASELPGYSGVLSNDSGVEGSSSYHSGEQKVGLIWRDAIASLITARIILRNRDFEFAGRPPLEVELELAASGERLYVIIFHAKAGSGDSDWARRRDGSAAIADYLRSTRSGDDFVVIGDFNDDLDESIRRSRPSPYESLVDDYFFATFPLARSNTSTTVRGRFPIDHAMVSDSLAERLVSGSADVFPLDDFIADYRDTTSDHFPVHFALEQELIDEPDQNVAPLINEILANESGGDVSGEFVEIVNVNASAISLSGWTLRDRVSIRHQFGSDATIESGEALVVTGGASIASADSVGASSGSLGLNNSGDTVSLISPNGSVVVEVAYSRSLASRDGVSMTRATDGDVESGFVPHNDIASANSSPGTRSNGTSF